MRDATVILVELYIKQILVLELIFAIRLRKTFLFMRWTEAHWRTFQTSIMVCFCESS